MSTIVMTPELEARIREIVREELLEVEAVNRPPWTFDRMDAAMRRIEEKREPTAGPRAVKPPLTEPLGEA